EPDPLGHADDKTPTGILATWMEASARAASKAELSRLPLGSLRGLHQAGHDDRVQVAQGPVHQAAQDGPVPRCAPADEGAVGSWGQRDLGPVIAPRDAAQAGVDKPLARLDVEDFLNRDGVPEPVPL